MLLVSDEEGDELLVGAAVAALRPPGALVRARSVASALSHLDASFFGAVVVGVPPPRWDASALASVLGGPDGTPVLLLGEGPLPGPADGAHTGGPVRKVGRDATLGAALASAVAWSLATRAPGGCHQRGDRAHQGATGLVRSDLLGRIVAAEGELLDSLGWCEQALLWRRVSELCEPGEREPTEELDGRVLSGELASYRAVRRLLDADGASVAAVRDASVVFDDAGRPSGLLIRFRSPETGFRSRPGRAKSARARADTGRAGPDGAARALRLALERDELRVHYQPVIDVGGARVVGLEALVRWQHPERGLVGPAELLPIAERSHLIVDVGAFVLAQALRQVARWQSSQEGCAELWVSVNLSPSELALVDPASRCAAAFESSGALPGALRLEVTESAVMADVESSIAKLAALRSMGIDVAIDDFGVGCSSLEHLSRLPVGTLKIDRSFVQAMGPRSGGTAIVSLMADLGASFGLALCAQGVETAHQLALLGELGCQLGQGYLWCHPLPAEELEAWLEEQALTARVASATLEG